MSQDRIALQIVLLKVHRADLDKDVELVPNENITGDRNIAIGGHVLEADPGSNAENKAKSDGDISSHSNHSFNCKTPTSASLFK
jgi:hypothetical protein